MENCPRTNLLIFWRPYGPSCCEGHFSILYRGLVEEIYRLTLRLSLGIEQLFVFQFCFLFVCLLLAISFKLKWHQIISIYIMLSGIFRKQNDSVSNILLFLPCPFGKVCLPQYYIVNVIIGQPPDHMLLSRNMSISFWIDPPYVALSQHVNSFWIDPLCRWRYFTVGRKTFIFIFWFQFIFCICFDGYFLFGPLVDTNINNANAWWNMWIEYDCFMVCHL